MNSNKYNWKIIEKIYEQALALKPEDRNQYVKKQADGNTNIYNQVVNMLKIEDNDEFMSGIPNEITTEALNKQFDMSRIGHFEIITKIASGGMGVVYKAQSKLSDVKTTVALKTIRVELKNDDLESRFLNEKTILSKLKHKNIASLIDAGVSNDGVPYIATEWVDGDNIMAYCDKNKLGLKSRLELFLQLCSAVSHAHNQFIIHRDIKPANILIDNNDQVKLLDFGIAKLVEDDNLNNTQTQIFTPEYAAPEQINGKPCGVVTDVYAMGVLLFEMLTAEKRFNLDNLSLPERIQTICKPTVINASTAIKKSQHPIRSNKLKGALNIIINKAMHVDENRRYETIAILQSDISRYLSDLPITAIKDSWFYRVKMFLKRNMIASILTSLLFVSLTVGLIYSIHQTQLVRQEALKSQQLYEFYKGSYNSAAPVEGGDTTISAREMFINGAQNFDLNKISDLYVRAQIASDIARVLSEFEAYDLEKEFLTHALDFYTENMSHYPTEFLHTSIIRSVVEQNSGNSEQAILILSQAYKKSLAFDVLIQKRTEALINLGLFNKTLYKTDLALDYYNQAEVLALQVKDYASIAKVNYYKYSLLVETEDNDVLEKMLQTAQINFEKAYQSNNHPDLLSVKNSKAMWYTTLGEYEKANETFINLDESYRAFYGVLSYPQNINHANVHYYLGNFEHAIKLTTSALDRMDELKIKPGFKHMAAKIIQARALTELKDYQSAEYLFQQAYEYFNEILPSTHIAMLTLNTYRMDHYLKSGDFSKALELSQEMDSLAESQLIETASTKTRYVNIMLTLANLNSAVNQHPKALNYYLKANEVMQSNTKKQGWIYWVIQAGIEKSHYKLKNGYNDKQFKLATKNLYAILHQDNWYTQFFDLDL